MKLIIDKNRKVYSAGTWGTVNENDYEILEFEFPAELEEYNKRIVYYLGDERVWDTIVNNKAYITNAITTKGDVKAYVWCTKENTEREADTDFRTMLFEMHFYENENADGIVPTPEQVDGFNTMLTAMNEKIEEIDELETTIENAETQRQANETTRQNNEATRQENEQTRQEQEADRERRTDEAIGEIEDLTEEYNQNAQQKTEAFNNNATQKTDAFNSNAESKTSTFNTNATNKTNDFNSNASSKTTAFNENATSKTNTFNSNANDKTSTFNDNATQKTTNFDNNASSKTTTFNENAASKTNDFNDNATQKTTDFNNNAQAKTDAFDEHTAEITADIEELQQEVKELSENMPWNTTEQATEIQVTDAAKYSKNKLELFGNTSQKSYQGYNLIDVSPYQEGTKSGVTLTKDEEGNLIFNGTATAGISWSVTLSQSKTLPAGTYTKNVTKDTSIGTGITVGLGYNGSSISRTIIQPSAGASTMTLENDMIYDQIRMWIAGGTVFNNYKLSYMILSGEYTLQTIPDYEPYTGGVPSPNPDYPQPIHVVTGNNSVGVQGKNLFDKNTQNIIAGAFEAGSTTIQAATYSRIAYMPIKSNTTYTIQKIINAGANRFRLATSEAIPTTGVKIHNVAISDNTTSRTITNISDNYLLILYSQTNQTTTPQEEILASIQVEEGSTATSYEPYYHADYPINLGSIELCKIGDYQDYLYKENGNWYKYGAISYNIATGASAEQWTWTLRNENKAVVQSTHIGQCGDGRNFIAIFSNYYKGATGSIVFSASDNTVNIIGCAEQNKIRIAISPNDFANIDDFKNFLQENNLDFYFVLATPIITQITDETLISQLEAIYNHLALVKGTNHITITPSDLEPYVTLNYMQDLPSKLDNLDSRLSLLE